MFWVLLRRWLVESRLLWLTCAVGLFAFCWVRVWIISQLPTSSFETIAEQLWKKYERFSTVPFSQLVTYHGRVALAFDEPIILLGIAVWVIARGSDTVAGKLNRGVMEMLLGQPVSRLSVYSSQVLVTVTGTALLAAIVWAGIALGIATVKVPIEKRPSLRLPIPGLTEVPIPFAPVTIEHVPISTRTDARYFIYPALNLFCWGLLVSGLATCWSAFERHRWRTIGVLVAFLAVQMVVRLISMVSAEWKWLEYLTIFTAYDPQAIVFIAVRQPESLWALCVTNFQGQPALGPLGCYLTLVIPAVVAYCLGGWYFCKRDLPAPI
jgi:ABC-2 type transport system permease protein